MIRITYHLAFKVDRLDGEELIDARLVLERHKAKATRVARLLVHHARAVNDWSVLLKVAAERLGRHGLRQTADEYLLRPRLLRAWNGALRINLDKEHAHQLVDRTVESIGPCCLQSCHQGSVPVP